MDQDAVWYRGSLGLGRGHIVLDGNPTRLRHKECTCMMFVVTKRLDGYLVRCMVGLGPGNTVLDADPAPLPRGTASTQISALVCCGQMAGWIEMPWYEGRPQPRPHCVTYGDPAPTPERGTPPIFSPCLLWAIKTVDHLSYCWALVLHATANSLLSTKTTIKSLKLYRIRVCLMLTSICTLFEMEHQYDLSVLDLYVHPIHTKHTTPCPRVKISVIKFHYFRYLKLRYLYITIEIYWDIGNETQTCKIKTSGKWKNLEILEME